MNYSFQQVDVFSNTPCMGNPVAVFLDSQGLSSEDMQKIARWTNLSETTFVSSSNKADYFLRIFTPSSELPFAGHPTLGTAWALRKSGIIQKDNFVQECAFGLINININNNKVFFQLPKYTIEDLQLDYEISNIMGVSCKNSKIITTGPRWMLTELADSSKLYDIIINNKLLFDIFKVLEVDGITVYIITKDNSVHVRSFFESNDILIEDSVCGSGNAAVAVHIMHTGNNSRVGNCYEAFQGSALKRDGRITVMLGDKIRIGGFCHSILSGTATF